MTTNSIKAAGKTASVSFMQPQEGVVHDHQPRKMNRGRVAAFYFIYFVGDAQAYDR
jgi:hypothetical protein